MSVFKKYFVYTITNKHKNVLYTGITNNLRARVHQHYEGNVKGFSSKYNCKYLIHYEVFDDVSLAIQREKSIKKFRREKKNLIIEKMNPDWKFLNELIDRIDDKYL